MTGRAALAVSAPRRRFRDRLRASLGRLPFGRPRLPPLFYDPGYTFALPNSPLDPLRGEKVITALDLMGLLRPGLVTAPAPASLRDLLRVHDREYVESLGEGRAFEQAFGTVLTAPQRERVLSVQRAMTGGTLAAARHALAEGGIAVNLGGGFHHARRDRGAGFCLFNDVAVAVAALRRGGFAGPVLVVDLDLHDGDGTRALFATDPSVHTYSLHNRNWDDPAAVGTTAIELGGGVGDERYLEVLRQTLPPVLAAQRPELVFYLAGCDPAADDRLGDWQISADGMLARDRLVLELTRGRGTGAPPPVVLLLAGGYGEHAWSYTARLLASLASDGRHAPKLPPDDEVLIARYRALARVLSPAELSGEPAAREDDWGLSDEDLAPALQGGAIDSRFLGYYTPHGVELVLEVMGIFDRLRDLSYEHPHLELDLTRPHDHTLRVWGDRDRAELLAELRARRDRQQLPGFELLSIEWLLLQNPRASFSAMRPALPGQRHPGLGMLSDVLALLVQVCHRLHLDGLSFTPSHFHLAAQASKYVRFREPADAATFDAVMDLLGDRPLPAASRLVEDGRVSHGATGDPFRWRPLPMVLPTSEALVRWFEEQGYEARRAEARRAMNLVLAP